MKQNHVLVGLIILFLITRLVNLQILPIFQDESAYLALALKIASNPFKFWDHSLLLPIAKPPLFILLEAFFLRFHLDFLISARFVSVVSGFSSLIGVYFLTKHLTSTKTALIAVLLYIVSPFTLFYDRLAIMESMLTALTIWAVYHSVRFRQNWARHGIWLMILIGAALLTKQTGNLTIAVSISALIFTAWSQKSRDKFNILTGAAIFISLGYLISFLLRLSPNYNFYQSFKPADLVVLGKDSLFPILINNLRADLSWFKSFLTYPVFILSIVAFGYLFFKQKRQFLILIAWLLLPIFIQSTVAKSLFPRYLLVAFPPVLVSLAILINAVVERSLAVKFLLLIGLFLLFFQESKTDYYLLTKPYLAKLHYNERWQYISNWPSGYGIKEAATYIKGNLPNGTVIFSEGESGHLADTLSFYLPREYQIVAYNRDKISGFETSGSTIIVTNNSPNFLKDKSFNQIFQYIKPGGESAVEIYSR